MSFDNNAFLNIFFKFINIFIISPHLTHYENIVNNVYCLELYMIILVMPIVRLFLFVNIK